MSTGDVAGQDGRVGFSYLQRFGQQIPDPLPGVGWRLSGPTRLPPSRAATLRLVTRVLGLSLGEPDHRDRSRPERKA